jgi:KDO2-lipid IV(A) lauroyltransferase
MGNLNIAFPEKSVEEHEEIAKQFYHNLIDTFMETIKFVSWKYEDAARRFEFNDAGLEAAYKCGKPIHVIGMHNFNWEFVNWILSKRSKYPFLAIYMPIVQKDFNKIIYEMRSRYGTILLPATNFKRSMIPWVGKQHVMASAADQSPGNPKNAFWVDFFGRETAFVTGPEKGARVNDAAVVFAHFYSVRRGYYKMDTTLYTEHALELPEGKLTHDYAKYIETCLRERPSNYLWSHRRWKHSRS